MEIATIAIMGAAVLGRLLLERIVGRMLRDLAGEPVAAMIDASAKT